jgi:L-ascorbate metabolism protein UlaG (beta-lactamase superfamily)
MVKRDSAFAVVFTFFALLLFAGVQQDEYAAAAGPHPVQKPRGGPLPVEQAETGDSLTLTYVANMGVLVNSTDSKVMIDCLFDGPTGGRYPGPETLDSLMKGIPPFDDVDLVLVTHRDRDHFDSAVVARYMETRPEPILVVPADAAERLRAAESDWSEIESRVVVVDLDIGKTLDTVLANIHITIFSTTHGTSPYPMNLMYLLEANDWRVFYEGDASGRADDYRAFGLDTVEFDLAVMQYSWPLHPHRPYRFFFQNDFTSAHIALAHVHKDIESVAEERIDEVRKHYADIFVLLPGMPTMVFRK